MTPVSVTDYIQPAGKYRFSGSQHKKVNPFNPFSKNKAPKQTDPLVILLNQAKLLTNNLVNKLSKGAKDAHTLASQALREMKQPGKPMIPDRSDPEQKDDPDQDEAASKGSEEEKKAPDELLNDAGANIADDEARQRLAYNVVSGAYLKAKDLYEAKQEAYEATLHDIHYAQFSVGKLKDEIETRQQLIEGIQKLVEANLKLAEHLQDEVSLFKSRFDLLAQQQDQVDSQQASLTELKESAQEKIENARSILTLEKLKEQLAEMEQTDKKQNNGTPADNANESSQSDGPQQQAGSPNAVKPEKEEDEPHS